MANQQPSAQARILIAGYGAIGKTMHKQAPHCHFVSLNRSASSATTEHIQADLTKLDIDFPRPCPDFLVYTATPDTRTPEAYQKTYVDGLKKLLLWAKGQPIKHIFYVSSTSVYGQDQAEEVNELSMAQGASFSGRAILEGEQLLAQSGFNYTLVRFGGIYGNGREMLLRLVTQGVELAANPAPLTNRIHEEDCAAVLLHLMARVESNQSVEPIYVAVDDDGADKAQVYQFIESELGLHEQVQLLAQERPSNLGKRCLNQRLKRSGYQFLYPSYREGYGALIREKRHD